MKIVIVSVGMVKVLLLFLFFINVVLCIVVLIEFICVVWSEKFVVVFIVIDFFLYFVFISIIIVLFIMFKFRWGILLFFDMLLLMFIVMRLCCWCLLILWKLIWLIMFLVVVNLNNGFVIWMFSNFVKMFEVNMIFVIDVVWFGL